MKEYCFCYWRSGCLPTDTCVKVDLGVCRSVKAATLRVIKMIAEDPFFSPDVDPRFPHKVGSLCTMDGCVCAILIETRPRCYRWEGI